MSEDVKYQNGIVTFMDLLGFRSLLRDKSPQELSRIMNIFISEGNPREGYDSDFDSMFTYAAISDCFFRAANTEHEINQKHPTGHFYHEIMDIVFIQCHLLMEGYLLRGAMTYGQYYGQHGENGAIVFGPAISRAYELESSHALHPRVIVDPYLIDEYWANNHLKLDIHNTAQEWDDYLSKLLRQDESGVWYIDYLEGISGNFNDEPEGSACFYLHHKELIEGKLNEWISSNRTGPDGVSSKLIWLANYHNSFMDGLMDKDWDYLLSGADGEVRRCDFYIDFPDHPLFVSYSK